MLLEGRPRPFDGGGSPTAFVFDAEQVIYRGTRDVLPVINGVAWSEGGDLVVGYGFSSVEFPEPLVTQLAVGGRLIIPVGKDSGQHLIRVTLGSDGQLHEEAVDSARFVPLTGEEGWQSD